MYQSIAGLVISFYVLGAVLSAPDARAQSTLPRPAAGDTLSNGLRPQLLPDHPWVSSRDAPATSEEAEVMAPDTAFPEFRPRALAGDAIAALKALDVALTQAGDGATYVWHHGNGRLNGAIHLTRTFRDADGHICRHLQMLLNSGTTSRKREGIACRGTDGTWELGG